MMGKFQISNFKFQILITLSSLLILAFIAVPVEAAPSCNSITLNVNPNPVPAGGSAIFSISGEASLYQNNSFTGGVSNCNGAWFDPWNSKSCTTTSAGTYRWTHTWKYCEGSFDNCSPTCSASKDFIVSAPVSPCDTTYKDNKFHACYFNGTNPESGSILSQADENSLSSPVGSATAFDYNWGGGSVGNSGKTDQVSAIWRGRINFQAGTYVFHVRSDDGVTLDVEGYGRIIDAWRDQAPTTYNSASINLPAGYRNVAVRWYENGGGAYAKLWWDWSAPPVPPPPPPTGLTATCSDTSGTLSWTPTAGATSYMVRIDDGDGLNNSANAVGAADNCGSSIPHDICVNGWSSNTMNISTTAGKTYRWWVHACNSAGCSTYTNGTDFTCEQPIPSPTHGPSSATSCGTGLTRATGLVSTLTAAADNKFNSVGACIVDPKTYFVEQKIPDYEGLKTRYFTQAKESSIVRKAVHNGDTGEGGLNNYLQQDKNLIHINGNLGMNTLLNGNKTAVVFVEGSLRIVDTNFTYGNGSSGIVFVVKGDVYLNKNVTQFNGVIISSGTIYTGTPEANGIVSPATCNTSSVEASALEINGSLISLDKNKPVKFCRKLPNNARPAEVINQQPKYLVILKELFSDTVQRWSEIVP